MKYFLIGFLAVSTVLALLWLCIYGFIVYGYWMIPILLVGVVNLIIFLGFCYDTGKSLYEILKLE